MKATPSFQFAQTSCALVEHSRERIDGGRSDLPIRASKHPMQSVAVTLQAVAHAVEALLGTAAPTDAPLMGAGLDSVAAVELIATLSSTLGTDLEPTALFDHPTIASLGRCLTSPAVAQPAPQPGTQHCLAGGVIGTITRAVEDLIGTDTPTDAPLMGAGLDSVAAIELVSTLCQHLSTEVEPTALFDHPTIGSLGAYFSSLLRPAVARACSSATPPSAAILDEAARFCFVVATACYLPTTDYSTTKGDLQGLSRSRCDTCTRVPLARWNADSFDAAPRGADAKRRARYGSFLQGDFTLFDTAMFRLSSAEAGPLEPQQRLLLEVGYEALHRREQRRSTLVDSDSGNFTGMMNMDAQAFVPSSPGPYDLTGVSYSAAGARLSFVFAMRGPCVVFDTACSSSLIATHCARRCMEHGECPRALVIGPNAILHQSTHLGLASIGMTSVAGRCHTFDARADGYLRGEGCGAVVLEAPAVTCQ